jgi:formimidoylglutamate deiminase
MRPPSIASAPSAIKPYGDPPVIVASRALVSNSVLAPYALLPDGWERDVRIDIDADGTIARITPRSPVDGASLLRGPVIAGMPNAHSHAFQRAFAGRAERATGAHDSFWTWRAAMYGLANRLTPEQLEAVAAQVYVEMLEAGYTAVGEFHYLHHAPGGVRYGVRSEMAQRIIAAADAAGIGLTLLPVLYRYSGFDAQPPLAEQARFVMNVDDFLALLDEIAPLCRTPQRRLGIAPHSLRAVSAVDLSAVVAALDARDPSAPVHLHVAEQSVEVEACIAASGQRPVAWLLDHAALSRRWCLVHATHVNADEVARLAATTAVVCIAPTTEANLGDGIFPLEAWRASGGATAIGSDSHASVDVAEELRWLEYAQRLKTQRRAIAPSPEALYVDAARAGAHALARPIGSIAAGHRADFVILDAESPALAGGEIATLVDRFVVAGGRRAIADVYAGGAHLVAGGRHRDREAIFARYRRTLAALSMEA